ncbi:MAG: tRNA threonylcarbamoyladenosine dehydratase [Candidatus Limiplasma sp.]|nr:tRNA threonylcarbamoyladenosine dehydratase [Clostridiales bacterium]MDY3815283.1 tRNA threonylcarbamoyladenosine dehydratase [Candidatus Limiplasma sp.]
MISRTERLNRTALLRTPEEMEALAAAHVMLLGLGGVGSYAAEALCRAGIGEMTLVDNDTVAPSNLNRQLPALVSTIGQRKTDVVAQRMKDIAPDMALHCVNAFYLPENPVRIPENCTLVIDAIDTVSAKIDLAVRCNQREIPLISCMGMGNRLDPAQIRLGDLFQTTNCPLCRVMRRELRKRGVTSLPCVYSLEPARAPRQVEGAETRATGRTAPGSVSYVPSVAGLYLAYAAVEKILAGQSEK